MADKRKARKQKEDFEDKPTKDEYNVAKYLRKHLPVKKTTLLSHKVEYFTASRAIDCLLDSPWAKKGRESLFNSRSSIIEYLHTMLVHKFFHRARKIPVDSKPKKKPKTDRDDESSHAEDKKGKKKDKEKEKEDKKDSGTDTGKEKKKEKRKIKLDMHFEQLFLDGNEAYVWIYDPIPTTAWLIGGLLVVGAILLCLFPLWPSSVRKGVYYLSIGAAGFLCVIVALIIVRFIVFCIVWVLTMGRHHLWILPNLTEDVGFFESFWPLFKYEYKGSGSENEDENEADKNDDKSKKKKEKDSDDDDEEEKQKGSDRQEGIEDDSGNNRDNSDRTDSDRDSEDSNDRKQDDKEEQQQQQQPRQRKKQKQRRDSTGNNGDGNGGDHNGFEFVNRSEVENIGPESGKPESSKTACKDSS